MAEFLEERVITGNVKCVMFYLATVCIAKKIRLHKWWICIHPLYSRSFSNDNVVFFYKPLNERSPVKKPWITLFLFKKLLVSKNT